MMSDLEDCTALPRRISLCSRSKENVPRRFIKDRQQLESVLGPSNPNWFEDASRRKLQQALVTRSFDSVIDSPILTPRISQICTQELRLGNTPDGSSFSPITVERYLSSQPYGSTPDLLHKPRLGNSPCVMSPIGIGASQPCPTIAQSLGVNVEESVLDWTNSLATPPRDMSSFADEKSPADSGKTKEIARSLFSPSKKLDTSCDSIKPLDSTCEDEPCDMSADHNITSHVTANTEACDLLLYSSFTNENNTTNNFVKSNAEATENNEKLMSTVIDKDSSINFDSKTSNVRISDSKQEKNGNTKTLPSNSDNVKSNINYLPESGSAVSKQDLSAVSPLQHLVRTDARQPLNNSVNESSDFTDMDTSICNSVKVDSAETRENCIEGHTKLCQSSPISNSVTGSAVSPNTSPVTANVMTSPTFSQKSSRKRNKGSSETSKDNRYAIDTALSDFFDPPSSAVGRRRRAPQKRKSLDMDTYQYIELDVSNSDVKCSTPKSDCVLQSILSSKKKEKRSNKKVRFSDTLPTSSTKKVTFSSDHQVIEAKHDEPGYVDNNGNNLKPALHRDGHNVNIDIDYIEAKQEEFVATNYTNYEEGINQSVKYKLNSHKQVHDKHEANEKQSTRVNKIAGRNNKLKQTEVNLTPKALDHISYSKRRCLKQRLKKDKHDDSNSRINDIKTESLISNKSVNSEAEVNNSTGDEFSQVSPAALEEMCNVACNTVKDSEGQSDSKPAKCDNHDKTFDGLKKENITFHSCIAKPVKVDRAHLTPSENSSKASHKGKSLGAARKFFYPSHRQISTSCPKKMFEFKDDRKKEVAGLVKSVSVCDLIQKHVETVEVVRKTDSVGIGVESDSNVVGSGHTRVVEPEACQNADATRKMGVTSPVKYSGQHSIEGTEQDPEITRPDSIPSSTAEVHDSVKASKDISVEQKHFDDSELSKQTASESFGFKNASGKRIVLDVSKLKKARKLLTEDYESKLSISFMGAPSSSGFKLGAENVKLEEDGLKMGEKILNEETSKDFSFSMNDAKLHMLKEEKDSPHFMGFTLASGNHIKLGDDALKKAEKLMSEDLTKSGSTDLNEIKAHLLHPEIDTSYFGGFKLASGSHIMLEESALKKAEQLIKEDIPSFDSSYVKGIKVSSQSVEKAQKLAGISVSPKENNFHARLKDKDLQYDKIISSYDIDVINTDFESSEWFEEMEQPESIAEEKVSGEINSFKHMKVSKLTQQCRIENAIASTKLSNASNNDKPEETGLSSEQTENQQPGEVDIVRTGTDTCSVDNDTKCMPNESVIHDKQSDTMDGITSLVPEVLKGKEEGLRSNMLLKHCPVLPSFHCDSYKSKSDSVGINSSDFKLDIDNNIRNTESAPITKPTEDCTKHSPSINVVDSSDRKLSDVIITDTDLCDTTEGLESNLGNEKPVKSSFRGDENENRQDYKQTINIDATGDYNMLTKLPSEIKLDNFQGFKTAAGKTLAVSDISLKKASRYLDTCSDSEADSVYEQTVRKSLYDDNFVSSRKDKIVEDLVPSFSKTESFEDEIQALTELKSKIQSHRIPIINNSSDNDTAVQHKFQGFKSADGKKFNISESSLKKAANLINNNTDVKPGSYTHDCKRKQSEAVHLSKNPDIQSQKINQQQSVEEELESLIAMRGKNSGVCAINKGLKKCHSALNHGGKRISKFSPGANVPQGYRPFKAPRVVKSLISGASKMDKETTYRMGDANENKCEVRKSNDKCGLVGLDKEKESSAVEPLYKGSIKRAYQERCDKDKANQDENMSSKCLENKLNTNSEQSGEVEQKEETCIKECYDGLLSQIFADEMEPSDFTEDKNKVYSLGPEKEETKCCVSETTNCTQAPNKLDYQVRPSLAISKSEEADREMENISAEELDSVSENKESIDLKYKSGQSILYREVKIDNNFQYGGFTTALGKKFDIEAKSLLNAANLLKDSIASFRKGNIGLNTIVENSETKDVLSSGVEQAAVQRAESCTETNTDIKLLQGSDFDIQTADKLNECIIPDVEFQNSENVALNIASGKIGFKTLSQKTHSDVEVPQMCSSSFVSSGMFKTASGKEVKISEKSLKAACSEFDFVAFQKSEDLAKTKKKRTEEAVKTTVSGSDKDYFQHFKGLASVLSEQMKPAETIHTSGNIQYSANEYLQRKELDDSLLQTTEKMRSSTESPKNVGSVKDCLQRNKLDISNGKSLCMFQTAGGNIISVSDKALRDCRSRYIDAEESVSELEPQCPETETKKNSFHSSDTKVDISPILENFNEKLQEVPEAEFNSVTQSLPVNKTTVSDSMPSMPSTENLNFLQDRPSVQEENTNILQTASIRNIDIPEKACNIVRETFESCEENQTRSSELNANSLFHTASDKVKLSEDVVDVIRSDCQKSEDFKDECPKVSYNLSFQTSSVKNLNISEDTLKKAGDILTTSSENKTALPNTQCCSLFHAANGQNLSISTKALTEVSNSLGDNDIEINIPEAENETSVQSFSDRNNTVSDKARKTVKQYIKAQDAVLNSPLADAKCLFQTASGKSVIVSEKALKVARDSLQDCDADFIVTDDDSSSLFQTASGNFEKVSQVARDSFKNYDADLVAPAIDNACLFQTASGKSVTVSEKALIVAKDCLKDSDGLPKVDNGSIFQSASDKNVIASEKALKLARDCLKDGDLTVPKVDSSSLFQTASGKDVTVSEKALKYARDCLKDDAFTVQKVDNSSSFQTASGKNVNVSEKALRVARDSLKDSDGSLKIPKVYSGSLFQTARGKSVTVSENSLKVARDYLTESDADFIAPKVNSNSVFQTASGKSVSVSEKAIKVARKVLNDTEKELKIERDSLTVSHTDFIASKINSGTILQTASGKNVTVSEKALKVARDCLKESDGEFIAHKVNSDSLFQTASGKSVSVSERALKEARDRLKDSDGGFMVPRVDNGSLFQTASCKKMTASEKSLKIAKETKIFYDEMLNVTKDESYPQFQVASHKNLPVSETILKEAGECLNGIAAEFDLPSERGYCSFETASGKNVSISESSLKEARACLKDPETDLYAFKDAETKEAMTGAHSHDTTLKDTDKNIQTSKLLSENANAKYVELVPVEHKKTTCDSLFQTASGRNVDISETALSISRKKLLALGTSDDNGQSELVPVNSQGSGMKDVFANLASGDLSTSLQQLSEMKRNLQECKTRDKGKVKRGNSGSDELEVENIQSKRPRLDSGNNLQHNYYESFGSESADRVPLRSGPEGILTDRRFGVNRGFRPVRSQTLFKPPARVEHFGRASPSREANRKPTVLKDLTEGGSAPKKSTPTKSSFHTPYKTTPTKTSESTELPEVKVTVHAPVFVAKYRNTAADSKLPSVQNCAPEEFFHKPVTGEKGDTDLCKAEHYPAVAFERRLSENRTEPNTKEMSLNIPSSSAVVHNIQDKHELDKDTQVVEFIQNMTPVEVVLKKDSAVKVGSNIDCRIKAVEDIHLKREHLSGTEETDMDIDSKDGVARLTENSRIKLADNNSSSVSGDKNMTDDKSVTPFTNEETVMNDKMDCYTQDDEAEIFYCNLVEARKKQEEIIKQKGKMKIQPSQGRLYRMKQTNSRWKLKDFVRILRQCGQKCELPTRVVPVTSATARDYKFSLKDYYGNHVAHVLVGDGAYLVPDDAGFVGKQEFYSAFLTMDGVDSKLVSESWVHNHYRWIVWKLASYEVVAQSSSCGRYLTPEMVMLQLKYRYDREIDLCQRSALKKIFERDDAPGKRMVLCVAGIIKVSETNGKQEDTTYDLDAKILLELSDCWYSIKAQTDVPLTDLIRQGKITVGQKICVAGAELVGREDACSPLEAPDSIMMKICCNSCRPAPWDSVLGYQLDPWPLCVPLTGLYGEGGTVGLIDLIIVRKYPVMYMEKLAGGGCVFRSGKAEEKVQQSFQSKQQESMEKLYRVIEKEMEKDEKEERRAVSKKKWSQSEVEYLQSGREIHEALTSSRQPDIIEGLLTEKQICKLMDYKRQLQDEKQQELNARFQKAWQDRDEGVSVRNVTPVLKFRVAGCAHRDMDNKTSTVLTIWRPAPEICELQEGRRYKVYSLNTSTARSKYVGHDVQLTATKQTKFRLMNIDENFLDNIYEPREVLWASDISRRQPPYGEVDFVGVVIQVSHASQEDRQPETVYCADCQGNLLAIKFWHGIKAYDDGLLKRGNIICCSNLMDKSPYRSRQLPAVEASNEFTHITNKPQNSDQRQAVARLNTAFKDKGTFLEKAQSWLTDILEKKQLTRLTPEKRRFSVISTEQQTVTPTKTDPLNVRGSKTVRMEMQKVEDINLSMSIDSSFEEEMSKVDFESNYAKSSSDAETEKVSEQLVVTKEPTSSGISEQLVLTTEQTDLDISEQHVTTAIQIHSDTCSSNRQEKDKSEDFFHEKMEIDSSDLDTKENVVTSPRTVAQIENTNRCSDSDTSCNAEGLQCLQNEVQEEFKDSAVSNSELHFSIEKGTENVTKTPGNDVKSSHNCFPTSSNKSNLVKSPELDGVSQMTPQTVVSSERHHQTHASQNLISQTPKSSQSQACSLQAPSFQTPNSRTPISQSINSQSSDSQTPGSQEKQAIYQAKMARLLSYGSPSAVTPVKTSISRTAAKGFKPPSFVKK